MRANRLKDRLFPDAAFVPRDLGAEGGMQYERIGCGERVDRKPARRALLQKPFRRVQSREIVQKPGYTGLPRVDTVCIRKSFGEASDAHDVREAVCLRHVPPDDGAQSCIRQRTPLAIAVARLVSKRVKWRS